MSKTAVTKEGTAGAIQDVSFADHAILGVTAPFKIFADEDDGADFYSAKSVGKIALFSFSYGYLLDMFVGHKVPLLKNYRS